MSHGKREQKKFRAGALVRKVKAQNRENQKFNQETEILLQELRAEIKKGKTANSVTLRAAAAEVILDIYEGR